MTGKSFVDEINRQTMRDVVSSYAVYHELDAAEQTVFQKIGAKFKGKAILDLGVGGGRTTAALLQISTNYLGVDYVPEMVAACRARFPHARFEYADARSMPELSDCSFDVIVFACNGVSMVDHDGRVAILREARRLLAKGGVFVFSTYNRHSDECERGYTLPEFSLTKHPVKLAGRSARFVVHAVYSLINRLRYRRHEVHAEDYAMINDRCHHYATMLYYIGVEKQIEQLKSAGFESAPLIYGLQGGLVGPTSRDNSLTYYVPA